MKDPVWKAEMDGLKAHSAADHAALVHLVLAAIDVLAPPEPKARADALRAIGNGAMDRLDRAGWRELDHESAARLREITTARLMSLCSALRPPGAAAPAPD